MNRPIPIVQSCKQDDSTYGFITIKACPICEEWFHYKYILIAFYGHTYHPFYLFSHLQKSIRCAAEFCSCPILHPDWSLSMGLGPLNKEQEQLVENLAPAIAFLLQPVTKPSNNTFNLFL